MGWMNLVKIFFERGEFFENIIMIFFIFFLFKIINI